MLKCLYIRADGTFFEDGSEVADIQCALTRDGVRYASFGHIHGRMLFFAVPTECPEFQMPEGTPSVPLPPPVATRIRVNGFGWHGQSSSPAGFKRVAFQNDGTAVAVGEAIYQPTTG